MMPSRFPILSDLAINERLSEFELRGSRLLTVALIVLRHLAAHQRIRLTKGGAFNRKFVVWAVQEFQWPWYSLQELYRINKVLNEEDVLPLAILHDLLRASKIITHTKGHAELTKLGKMIIDCPGQVQALLFESFFTRFDFAAHERWPFEIPEANVVHFLTVVKTRLDDWMTFPEVADHCLPIPTMPQRPGWDSQEMAMYYLSTRLLRPLVWLGLMEQYEPDRFPPMERIKLRKTSLFDKFLRFGNAGPLSGTVH